MTLVFPAELPGKLRGWYTRMKVCRWKRKWLEMHLETKVYKTQVSPAGMLNKFRGWHVRRSHVHPRRVSSRFEEMWPRVFSWASRILYNQEDFNPKSGTKKKAVHRRSILSTPKCAAQPSLNLSYFTHPYILGHKRKRKEADYIFIHQCCISLLYDSRIRQWKH